MITLLALLVSLEFQDFEIGVGPDLYFQKLTGTMQFDERPTQSDRIDLSDDLGHHHNDLFLGAHAKMTTGPHRALFGFERWRSSWHHALSEPLVFDGKLFPPNERVRNRITVDRWKARYDYRIYRKEVVEVRAGIRAAYWLFEQIMDSSSVGFVDDHLGTVVVEPSVTVTAGPFAGVRFDAEVAGIYYRFSGQSVRTFETHALARWTPAAFLEISVGVRVGLQRFINLDPLQRNEIDLVSWGPVTSIEFRF